MAPIANPQQNIGPVRMAPISDPQPQAERPIVVAQRLAAPSIPAEATPDTFYVNDAPPAAGASEERTLASLLPGAARQTAYDNERAPAARPPLVDYAEPERSAEPMRRSPGRYANADPTSGTVPARQVAMRWVAGPAPAEIRSTAALTEAVGLSTSYAQPTIRPTFASLETRQAPIARQVERALDTGQAGAAVYVQAGAFVTEANAQRLRAQLSSYGPANLRTASVGGRVFHRVVMGPMANAHDADRALAMLRRMGHPEAHIVQR